MGPVLNLALAGLTMPRPAFHIAALPTHERRFQGLICKALLVLGLTLVMSAAQAQSAAASGTAVSLQFAFTECHNVK
jgi:hypothetical protein